MNSCPICDGHASEHARGIIRNQHRAIFIKCQDCGFIFVSNPTWLSEAYSEPINRSDTGYIWRNLWAQNKICDIIESYLNPAGIYLDYAAGYGIFVRLMRDAGYDFRWSDLYCQNLFARGFEAPDPLTGPFDAVTAFEVFEHLIDPREELRKISAITSCLIMSTTILPSPSLPLASWDYYGLDHGQHVSFYTRQSLEKLALRFGYQFVTNGLNLHVFYRHPLLLKNLFQPTIIWKRVLNRFKRIKKRSSLTLSDRDFIIEQLRQERTN